ncbi:MAG TPA: hypothetical protein VGC99_28805 [Candidatus Tectomicrobia bacterium]
MPLNLWSAGQTVVSTDASMIASMTCAEVLLQAHPSNTATIYLGTSLTQVFVLSAGTVLVAQVSQVNQLYAKTSAGSATLNWLTNARLF